MSTRTIVLVVILLLLICVGMLYYVLLAKEEYNQVLPAGETSVKSVVASQSSFAQETEVFKLPVANSVPTQNIFHTIPLEQIRRGCFRQDCIPSVDAPRFVEARTLSATLDPESLGIIIQESKRFYPFPMLETREIVNDVLSSGQTVAVTYCPLCGTGIVFDRTLEDGVTVEFGVSGMLWQSNLLMYNRADKLERRNLWSQVLGQAVVGERAGETLEIVPSDVITFKEWLAKYPTGETLTTGSPKDPYDGDYFGTAQFFNPDFDATNSVLPPTTRVHGIIVDGQPKAYVSDKLFNDMTDFVSGQRVFVEKSDSSIKFITSNASLGQAPTQIPDVEGFWFSWIAAHPETELWSGEN